MELIKPEKLEKGDTIAIIAPSGGASSLFPHRIANAKHALEQLGFSVKLFPTVSKFNEGSAGTVAERVSDIHTAFLDKKIKAIICTIGGTSANELLEKIDYALIRKNPKIFCGYSDITLLHCAFQTKAALVTFYGPAAMTQFGEYPEPFAYTVEFFLKAVASGKPIGKITPSEKYTDEVLDWNAKADLERPRELFNNKGYIWLREGKAEGKLTGGCLPSLLTLQGTKYELDYADNILFIETPEGEDFTKGMPLSEVSSALKELKEAKVFERIKALIVGIPFSYTQDEQEQFKEIIKEHITRYKFPVLLNVNIGHADPIITIPLGVKVKLDSQNKLFSIDEKSTKE